MNFHDRQKFLNASFSRAGASRQSLTINSNDARCSSKNAMRFNNNLHDELDTNINSNNNMRVRFDMKSNQNINPYDKLFVNRAGNNSFKSNNSQLNYSLVNNFNELPSNIDMYNTSRRPSDFSYNFDSIIGQSEKAESRNNDDKCLENDKNISSISNHGEDDFYENSKEKHDCICCVAAKINRQV
jgi:hypothetical protein